jgi:geranylgeranyl diphosphate synthase type II
MAPPIKAWEHDAAMSDLPSSEPLEQYLTRRAAEVNAALQTSVPAETTAPTSLHRAMRYSLLAGGKRLRPVLVLAAGEAFGARADALLPIACAMEMIHTYSLIHDDLPAMDNDDLRRGRPTSHKVFGEAMAILAGDALLTHAFLTLARHVPASSAGQVIAAVAEAAGAGRGMVAGQASDIEHEGQPVTPAALEAIHLGKTAALLRASVLAGGIVGGASERDVEHLATYGDRIGLAFQIADDILDVTASAEALGKTPGKDLAVGKATYPALYGLAESKARAHALVAEAIAALRRVAADTLRLEQVAHFIVARTS